MRRVGPFDASEYQTVTHPQPLPYPIYRNRTGVVSGLEPYLLHSGTNEETSKGSLRIFIKTDLVPTTLRLPGGTGPSDPYPTVGTTRGVPVSHPGK